jgi:hypothetical protein
VALKSGAIPFRTRRCKRKSEPGVGWTSPTETPTEITL